MPESTAERPPAELGAGPAAARRPGAGRRARAGQWLRRYLRKMGGTTTTPPPRVSDSEVLWSWIGSFLGISAVAWASLLAVDSAGDRLPLIGSLGASAVLVYGAPKSPLAQPRNLVGGHLISALAGVSCQQLLGGIPWLAAPLAVASAIALMQLTRTLHPPGGATALIAVAGSEEIHRLGFLYCLAPVGSGALLLLLVALLVNNLPATRRYPELWR
jgi:CBS-domain-containing membrane protein